MGRLSLRDAAASSHSSEYSKLDAPSSSSSSKNNLVVKKNISKTTNNQVLTPVVLCILVAETGERFAYFGFRAILVLYFVHVLKLEETTAIAAFAFTTCLAYFSPLFGALLADGQFGRYKVILYCGVLYVIGLAILTVGAWFNWESLSFQRVLTVLGLVLVCLGTGGIKPCVSSFGADQVTLQRTKSNAKSSSINEKEATAAPGSANIVLPIDGSKGEKTSSIRDGEDESLIIRSEDPSSDDDESPMDDETISQRVRAFFAYFYFCINVGAVASIAMVPIVRGYAGFGPAFSLSLWFMMIALFLFASKRKEYHHLVPGQDGTSLSFTLGLCRWLFFQNLWRNVPFVVHRYLPLWLHPGDCPKMNNSKGFLHQEQQENGTDTVSLVGDDETAANSSNEGTMDTALDEQLSDAAHVLHVLPIFCALPIFWCLYDQQGSVWTLQATKMRLHGLQPEQFTIINPVELMIFVPLFERIIYPMLDAAKVNISPLTRMSWGMLLSAISFAFSGFVESWIQHNNDNGLEKVSVFWQLPQITVLAVAEILVSVTGLEFAYACAPGRVKALIMSLFLLTTAVGNIFSGTLYSTVFAQMDRAVVMHICATLMMINLIMFHFLSKWWLQRRPLDLLRPLVVAEPIHQEVEMS